MSTGFHHIYTYTFTYINNQLHIYIISCADYMTMEKLNGAEVIRRKFGDEQSTLLDRFERLSFEVHLNQAMLGRSLSEPSTSRSQQPPSLPPPLLLAPPPQMVTQGERRRRRRGPDGSTSSGFQKVLKRLLKPLLRRRDAAAARMEAASDPKDPWSWKAFSRSMRV